MESSRSQGKVEILLPCQTHDPARGSFMVHPMVVKKGSGSVKRVPNPSYNPGDVESDPTLEVFRSCNHILEKRGRKVVEPHDCAFDFAVDYGR